MASQAQELVVTNSGQPLVAVIQPVTRYSVAQALSPVFPANVTVEIAPSS